MLSLLLNKQLTDKQQAEGPNGELKEGTEHRKVFNIKVPEEDQDDKSSESQVDLNYGYEEPDHATFFSWLSTQDANFKRAMRVLNHKESKNYFASPRKGRNEPQINPLLHKTRGQSSQYAQVLYIMKNYLNTSQRRGEEQDYSDYLAVNLDKIYYINFDNGLICERD